MINIGLRTEFSFYKAFAHIEQIAELSDEAICIADNDSTFGHYQIYKLCKPKKINPVLGVRLQVVDFKVQGEKKWGPNYIFIAKNNDGLTELYKLVRKAYDNFYYHPFLESKDIQRISTNIIIIAEYYHKVNEERVDYLGLSPFTPKNFITTSPLPRIAVQANRYILPEDLTVYQLFAGDKTEQSVRPQHILTEAEHLAMFGDQSAIANTHIVASQCDVSFTPAKMVKYQGRLDINAVCIDGAKRKGIDLTDKKYKDRYDLEMKLVIEKGFKDYFLIVATMIKRAKQTMLVGPSRGSSAGSLICYLMDITEIDPVKYDLLFERFIDLNREDLPDIDIDFPDYKRNDMVKHLTAAYGSTHVAHIATVAKMKPKSAIGIFAQNLMISKSETEELKGAIIERSGGDARAAMCVKDTFESTEIGKHFIELYPAMKLVEQIEGHSAHTGTHAAGIIVCNDELTKYGGVNSRDNVVMLDYREAEGLNLLKIDVLGLRTLSILEEVADRIKMRYGDYYKLPLDDEKVFKTFNDMRLFGIFQFEGYALQSITREMGVSCFDDLAAITSLARPGPIHSGGANLFVQRKTGRAEVEYLSNHPAVVSATEDTYGIIIYQEQLMKIAREYGQMSWEDVSQLRKAASKSLGEEFFNKYKDKFLAGTRAQGIDDTEADYVWRNMMTFGSWGFNKSHAVSYGVVSYWTAWAKTYYPLEFAAANMNNTRSEDSAIRILRDLVKHEGIKYKSIDPDESTERWEIKQEGDERILIGGLMNIDGIGVKKAAEIVKRRESKTLTRNQVIKLLRAETVFDILFPAQHHWGDLYAKPNDFGLDRAIDYIETIKGEGQYLFIGKLVDRNLRDLNEYQSVVKRDGKIITHDTLFLNLTFEDDTDSIIATIDRFRYEKLGRKIAESGKVGHDWYLVKGNIDGQWRRVNITEIINLWDWKAGNES